MPNTDRRVISGAGSDALGSTSDGSLPSITGTITVYTASGATFNGATGAFQMFNGSGRGESYAYSGSNQGFSFDANRSSSAYRRTDDQVHARNVKMYYLIKYI